MMQTLTALQQARLEVGAFPCLPDAMTVCRLLAADAVPAAASAAKAAAAAAAVQAAGSFAGGAGAGGAASTVRARSL